MTAPNVSSQSPTDKEERQSAECPPDNKLPENSQANLDARLDHAIEETFPTSDPVSVTITKGPKPDQETRSSSADDQQSRPEPAPIEHVLDQVREALNDVAGSASEAAGNVYSQGGRYARQARDQYPEAERYIREGQQAVTHRVTESPLLALFVAGAIGYALAWLIHGQRRGPDDHVPEYGRTNQGYAPHRDEQRRH